MSTSSTPAWTWVDVATVVIAAAALVVALVALLSDRWFRTRDSLNALLARFEGEAFYVRMWRVEQRSRPRDVDPSDLFVIKRFDVKHDPRAKEPVFQQALAHDWEHGGATMHDVYFFALRVRSWLDPSDRRTRRTRDRTRLLNATFGYSLLGSLLDHRMIACRLWREDKSAAYFPAEYGCLDLEYGDLVDRLWSDLKRHPSTPKTILEALETRYVRTQQHLDELRRFG